MFDYSEPNHLPLFGKISQKAKRKNDKTDSGYSSSQIKREAVTRPIHSSDEDLFLSQDMFLSHDNEEERKNYPENCMKPQLKVCGEPEFRESIFKPDFDSEDALPHPRKLFGRKRSHRQSSCRDKQSKSETGKIMDIHRNQLKSKQARRSVGADVNKLPPASLYNSYLESPSTSHAPQIETNNCMLSKCSIPKHSSDKVSTWDEVENWVHQRWKWNHNSTNPQKMYIKEE